MQKSHTEEYKKLNKSLQELKLQERTYNYKAMWKELDTLSITKDAESFWKKFKHTQNEYETPFPTEMISQQKIIKDKKLILKLAVQTLKSITENKDKEAIEFNKRKNNHTEKIKEEQTKQLSKMTEKFLKKDTHHKLNEIQLIEQIKAVKLLHKKKNARRQKYEQRSLHLCKHGVTQRNLRTIQLSFLIQNNTQLNPKCNNKTIIQKRRQKRNH